MKQKILNLIQRLWSARRQFACYTTIGISAVLADMTSLFILKEYFGFSPVFAVICNQPLIILFVFLANKKWSFKAAGQTRSQFIRFVTLVLINYTISVIWIWFFAQVLGINYLLAKIANIILAVSWNFLTYKYWIYAVHKPVD
ncbi:MAG: hypothetical protein A2821_03190 [Candidatus Magasanikbacteria bacterium RIFCSPHIGHO2_01_FULL_41_23]|uniref:GtrA/DPMS transmembrane domain-containing protein n=1 Tax=Candidatus Magasanikbacteria bacterium RIFCSPLOWO2_01_FULL_40_15 TaxID=1798686 RepID=A0A1F6N1S5_9BACT|nr:MAG: hypothetical protein A2821_03190 [Candidatus Magasanikbacteria bacterium RIFCSPHIGHO2_01_FULL_41_23]OGH76460.1 MAG: hypothetical protein A3F22_03180 [Candidatus Magasanikbacteria bacterium RIFCSPHIGHO2_12_FULL_41_16]OGH77946.1 MAG: hypothetical protein A2983_01215 [Candidatus Magasanikbacteria bacterium RIFCSPLOWO2_01_FULL_40_15]